MVVLAGGGSVINKAYIVIKIPDKKIYKNIFIIFLIDYIFGFFSFCNY